MHFCLRLSLLAPLLLSPALAVFAQAPPHIPAAQGTALDGHTVTLPHDLFPATILIVGFGRNSAAPAMAWGIKLQNITHPPSIGFYALPILAEAPSIVRPFIVRSMKKQVPDIIKPNFVALAENADTWKHIADYTPTAPDAAYVLLVDRTGTVRWQTHDPLSPAIFDQLAAATRKLATENH